MKFPWPRRKKNNRRPDSDVVNIVFIKRDEEDYEYGGACPPWEQ